MNATGKPEGGERPGLTASGWARRFKLVKCAQRHVHRVSRYAGAKARRVIKGSGVIRSSSFIARDSP